MTIWRSSLILLTCVVLCFAGCSNKPDDSAISNSIKAGLFSDAALKNEPIQIAVNGGEATLTGEVSSNEVRERILALAQSAPGVTKVNDALQIKPAGLAEAVPPLLAAPAPANYNPPPVAATPAPRVPNATTAPSAAPAAATPPPATPPVTAANTPPPTPAAAPAPAPPPPQPKKIVVPEGTNIRVITLDPIDSDKNKIGSTFMASLYDPITVDEQVVVPKNANIAIRLVDAASAGKLKGKSEIHISLDSVEFQGKRVPLQSSTYDEAGKSQGKQTAKRVGIGAAVGTAIGAIAGGGKGAAIGAGIGGGAGLASQAFKKGDKLQIPSETKIDFTLEKPVEFTIQPKATK